MPRIDDYINARKIAIEVLARQSFDEIIFRSGFKTSRPHHFRVPFLDRVYEIGFPEFEFEDEAEGSREVPIQEQILILHYMTSPGTQSTSGQWVSYREIPGASFYYSAFVKRAIDPLKKVFGQNISGLKKSAQQLGALEIEAGDAGFEFKVFPNVSLQLIVWEGDEEFPAEANILLDKNIDAILSPEDIAWLAGMLVYRLIALSR